MVIHVPFNVTRHTVRGKLIECWGYVGDYEVMVCISVKHAIEQGLISPPAKPGGAL